MRQNIVPSLGSSVFTHKNIVYQKIDFLRNVVSKKIKVLREQHFLQFVELKQANI
jgi:hypothetical protein